MPGVSQRSLWARVIAKATRLPTNSTVSETSNSAMPSWPLDIRNEGWRELGSSDCHERPGRIRQSLGQARAGAQARRAWQFWTEQGLLDKGPRVRHGERGLEPSWARQQRVLNPARPGREQR